jgi:hypothetical protein
VAGRPAKVDHVRETFLRASTSASGLVRAIAGLSGINPSSVCPRLHAEHARRVVELAFLGLMSAWEEFLDQSFVRYLAGARADCGFSPTLRLGKASNLPHAYHLISGDPDFDPARSYSRFADPKWVIAFAKIYFAQGAPYATVLQPSLELLKNATMLRNRVAHNSAKCREDFRRSAKLHLGLASSAPLTQGYSVGDLLSSPAVRIFGQTARDRGWAYFQAYNARLRSLARKIVPT